MEKIYDSFKSVLKNFPSNFLFFSSILNLSIGLFSIARFSTYEYYISETDVSGFGGLGLFGPFWAAFFGIIIFIVFLKWSFFLRNFKYKEIGKKGVFLFVKFFLSILIIIAAYFSLIMSILYLSSFESDILNYCNNLNFCDKKSISEYYCENDARLYSMCLFDFSK